MPHHLGRHNQDTAAAAAGQAKGTSPRPASNSGGKIEAPGIEATATQRTNSAPYPPLATTAPATDERWVPPILDYHSSLIMVYKQFYFLLF